MKLKGIIPILTIASFFVLTACLDKIDLDLEKGLEEGVVIRGELLKGDTSVLTVNLDRVYNFEISSLRPLNAKSVTLIDDKGEEMDIPKITDGLYIHVFTETDPIKVDFGGKYALRVQTFDGRTFESSLEEILPTPEIGEMYAERDIFNRFNDITNKFDELPALQFFVKAPLTLEGREEKAHLLWQVERTYKTTDNSGQVCYITLPLDFDEVHVLDGNEFAVDTANGFPLSKVFLGFEFGEGYYYTVYQKSISAGAYAHWNQTKQTINRVGGLVDPPVGVISTNFKNIADETDSVFGYFMPYTQDTVRLYVPPSQFETAENTCQQLTGTNCFDPCCNCVTFTGSQRRVPDFWEE